MTPSQLPRPGSVPGLAPRSCIPPVAAPARFAPTWLHTLSARRTAPAVSFAEVALFFDLDSAITPPDGYAATTSTEVADWLALGDPDRSGFLHAYWDALSYGRLQLTVVAHTDTAGNPVIPVIRPDGDDPGRWDDIAAQIVALDAARIWRQAGRVTEGDTRVIPSVCLVQNYRAHAEAYTAWNREITAGGRTYRVDDVCHLDITDALQVHAHENGHNFLGSGDLYGGGGGKVGSWDLLGDALEPGLMSDASSYFKARLGWLRFNEVISGPAMPARSLRLRPYATTGDCYKVVPDPAHNPEEYFLLEYRTSTGTENWRPDGARTPGGLLITHVNERLGEDGTASTVASPFMDVEECDGNDGKCWDDRGFCDLPWNDRTNASWNEVGGAAFASNNWPERTRPAGTLFPTGSRDSFSHDTDPSSAFYGGRRSGLSVTGITADGATCTFTLSIDGSNQTPLTLADGWRRWAGDFDGDGLDELLVFTGTTLAIVDGAQNQWHEVWRADGRLGQWVFRPTDAITVGDFNGDGRADVFIHSDHWAGLFLSDGRSLSNTWITGDPARGGDRIGGWRLSADDRSFAGDFDGDGRCGLFVRNGGWAGLLRFTGTGFESAWVSGDPAQNANWVGGWHLGDRDRHVVADFDGDGRAGVFTHHGGWAALLRWTGTGFEQAWISGNPDRNANWVGGWHIGISDRFLAGDFDGDGRADLWVSNPNGWAGWWRRTDRGFEQGWISGDPARNANWIDGWHLGERDRYVVADLDGDGRDDLFVRSEKWAAELLSDGSRFHVEWMSGDPARGANRLGPVVFDHPRDRELAVRSHYLTGQGIFQARGDGGTAALIRIPDGDGFRLDPTWLGPAEFAARDERVPVQRFWTGRFVTSTDDAVLVFDGRRLAVWSGLPGTPTRRGGSIEWIGEWHLGPYDRFTVADLDGDGLDEILVLGGARAAVLRWRDPVRGFTCDWISGEPARNTNWIDGWHLGELDAALAVDLDGDGRSEIFLRSPRWAGVLRWAGGRLQCVWLTGDPAANRDWIGGWHLGRSDRALAGRFRGAGSGTAQELFLRSPGWAGLVAWTGSGLDTVWLSGDPSRGGGRVGGWTLRAADREAAGRFGGTTDQVLVRGPRSAGLLAWDKAAGVMACPWQTGDPAAGGDWVGGWRLHASDRVAVADVDGDGRDEVVVRSPGWIGLLDGAGAGLTSRVVQPRDVGNWRLNAFDGTLRLRRKGRADGLLLHHPYGWTAGAELADPTGSPSFRLVSAQFRNLVS